MCYEGAEERHFFGATAYNKQNDKRRIKKNLPSLYNSHAVTRVQVVSFLHKVQP